MAENAKELRIERQVTYLQITIDEGVVVNALCLDVAKNDADY